MSTETGTAEAPSWLNDRDWLDGKTEIELSSRHLRAYWDADIIDVDDRNKHDTIIGRDDPFEVRFRVQLKGRLWRCICANWCFDVGFTAIGGGRTSTCPISCPTRRCSGSATGRAATRARCGSAPGPGPPS